MLKAVFSDVRWKNQGVQHIYQFVSTQTDKKNLQLTIIKIINLQSLSSPAFSVQAPVLNGFG